MSFYYTDEYNILMLISLLKKHHIKKVVVSPGATNVTFVGSIQQDDYFEIYSSVDERSAAYIATGLAAESGEPVVLSCTGATASRNYIPGLTEAYYRQLPVLAVTSTQHTGRVGQYVAQVIDRSVIQNDIAVKALQLPVLNKDDDTWAYEVMLNDALLALTHKGGGPVHINLETLYSKNFTVRTLPEVAVINRVSNHAGGGIPHLEQCRIGIVVGQHREWKAELEKSVERFCGSYNGVVVTDPLSNYKGKYKLPIPYVSTAVNAGQFAFDKLIYIGGAVSDRWNLSTSEVWTVEPDGSITTAYRNLRYVFEMTENQFFDGYNSAAGELKSNTSNYEELSSICKNMQDAMPELPFSVAWIAQQISDTLYENSRVYFGSADLVDKWNAFELPKTVVCSANVSDNSYSGVFSALVGAALVSPDKIHYLITDEDALYIELPFVPAEYIGKNVRIVAISRNVRDSSRIHTLANAQGMDYYSASDRDAFIKAEQLLLDEKKSSKPVVVEVFVSEQDEKTADDIIKKTIKPEEPIPDQNKKGACK